MEKTFLICDDKSENLFVGRLIRTDNQLNEHVKKDQSENILNYFLTSTDDGEDFDIELEERY